jgi:hypothetical protein
MAADYYSFVIIGKQFLLGDTEWPEMKGPLHGCGISRELLVND